MTYSMRLADSALDDIYNMVKPFNFSRSNGLTYYDLFDDGDSYVVQYELPGFKKDNIEVEFNNYILSVKAKCSDDRRIRKFGSVVNKSIDLSNIVKHLDIDNITAEFIDGLLEIRIGKSIRSKPKLINIK